MATQHEGYGDDDEDAAAKRRAAAAAAAAAAASKHRPRTDHSDYLLPMSSTAYLDIIDDTGKSPGLNTQ